MKKISVCQLHNRVTTPLVGSVVWRKPQSTVCECEVLASHRHTYLGSFVLEPEGITNLSIGAIWNCGEGTGVLKPSIRSWGTKVLF